MQAGGGYTNTLASERASGQQRLCVAVCCGVLQRVAACCSVLQCVAVCRLECVAVAAHE